MVTLDDYTSDGEDRQEDEDEKRSPHFVVVSSRSVVVRARCADEDGCDFDCLDWSLSGHGGRLHRDGVLTCYRAR